MHLQKTLNKIAAFIAVITIAISAMAVSVPMQTYAQTTTDLYGSDDPDGVNILKLLDMALNKGGMSMSPATIKAFLEFWWGSVKSDLNTCISNAGASVTTTTDLIDFIKSALQNPDADTTLKLPSLCLRYVEYCVKMNGKSLSDFKQLLTQDGTFREFLLSYVTDEDGNIATGNYSKLKKYNIGKSFVNMTREAADKYIEEYEGYYLIKTHKPGELSASYFANKSVYDSVFKILGTMTDDSLVLVSYFENRGYYYYFFDLSKRTLILNIKYSSGNYLFKVDIYNDNWAKSNSYGKSITYSSSSSNEVENSDFSISDIESNWNIGRSSLNLMNEIPFINDHDSGWLYTTDGRTVKIWKSLDAFKTYSVGKSNIYYSKDYSGYDDTADNSVTFTGSYYNGDYSHDTIQNNIDNSQTINESTVYNIVNNYITNNNYGDSSGSGSGSGTGSGSGGWWDIGSGISSFIEGMASLLDFILKLLGDLVGLLGTFLTSVLDVLSSLTALGQGFGDFLGATFTFLPEECISLIVSSIAAMCIVGVVKAFIK